MYIALVWGDGSVSWAKESSILEITDNFKEAKKFKNIEECKAMLREDVNMEAKFCEEILFCS